jgi:hypothetical protein
MIIFYEAVAQDLEQVEINRCCTPRFISSHTSLLEMAYTSFLPLPTATTHSVFID